MGAAWNGSAEVGGVSALVDTASVHTGDEQRDQHIQSADFLDVEKYQQIECKSTEVRGFDGETFILAWWAS